MPLLALYLLGATAAAPSLEQARDAARTAIDRADYDTATKIIDDALRRFGSLNNETVWTLKVMRGEIFNAQVQLANAKAALADELPRALRYSIPAVRRQLELAYASYGRTAEVTKHLEQAKRIAIAHQPSVLAEVYAKYVVLGEPKDAYTNAQLAFAEAKRWKDLRTEQLTTVALAYALPRAKRYSDAVEWGKRALPVAQIPRRIEKTKGNLGWAYIELGDDESAEEMLLAADADAKKYRGDRVPWLIQLGNVREHKRDRSKAEWYYHEALRISDETHPDRRFIYANLAIVAIETGRLDAAREYNAKALKLKKDPDEILRSEITGARIAAAEGNFAVAEGALRAIPAKTKNATIQWEASGRLAELFMKMSRTPDAIQEFQKAIRTVRAARKEVDSPELRLSFYNLTADIFSTYVDFLIQQKHIFEALTVTEEIRTDAIEDALESSTPRRHIDPRSVAKQRDATILSYWLGPEHSYVWTITPTSVRAAQLAPDTRIADAVNQHRRDLLNARAPSPSGRLLFGMLVPAVPRTIPREGRIIVVADGALHALNFDTLVVPASNHFWIEDAVITNSSSIGVLARSRPAGTRPPTMLLVGNPPQPDGYAPLPNAATEMNNISRYFPQSQCTKLEGPEATPAGYLAASPGAFDFIHFVAHGEASRAHPLDSAVILGDDKLHAREIVTEKLNARLVTISSCHGAGTRTYTGEGLVGLAWAFLHAGASNVIAALWEVNDGATPQLMDDFYKRTTKGEDPAAAFRKAKLGLLRSGGVTRYPRYWAPFVFYSG